MYILTGVRVDNASDQWIIIFQHNVTNSFSATTEIQNHTTAQFSDDFIIKNAQDPARPKIYLNIFLNTHDSTLHWEAITLMWGLPSESIRPPWPCGAPSPDSARETQIMLVVNIVNNQYKENKQNC